MGSDLMHDVRHVKSFPICLSSKPVCGNCHEKFNHFWLLGDLLPLPMMFKSQKRLWPHYRLIGCTVVSHFLLPIFPHNVKKTSYFVRQLPTQVYCIYDVVFSL